MMRWWEVVEESVTAGSIQMDSWSGSGSFSGGEKGAVVEVEEVMCV